MFWSLVLVVVLNCDFSGGFGQQKDSTLSLAAVASLSILGPSIPSLPASPRTYVSRPSAAAISFHDEVNNEIAMIAATMSIQMLPITVINGTCTS